jgi:hypothetical protein
MGEWWYSSDFLDLSFTHLPLLSSHAKESPRTGTHWGPRAGLNAVAGIEPNPSLPE